MAAGHSGQFTPIRLPVNTVIHTTLVGLEPATFRSLVRRATSSAAEGGMGWGRQLVDSISLWQKRVSSRPMGAESGKILRLKHKHDWFVYLSSGILYGVWLSNSGNVSPLQETGKLAVPSASHWAWQQSLASNSAGCRWVVQAHVKKSRQSEPRNYRLFVIKLLVHRSVLVGGRQTVKTDINAYNKPGML